MEASLLFCDVVVVLEVVPACLAVASHGVVLPSQEHLWTKPRHRLRNLPRASHCGVCAFLELFTVLESRRTWRWLEVGWPFANPRVSVGGLLRRHVALCNVCCLVGWPLANPRVSIGGLLQQHVALCSMSCLDPRVSTVCDCTAQCHVMARCCLLMFANYSGLRRMLPSQRSAKG